MRSTTRALLASSAGLAALMAFGSVSSAHAVIPASPDAAASAEAAPSLDCPRGWELVDPVTRKLSFELMLIRARARDDFDGINLTFDQATRNAWEAGELTHDEADRWRLGIGFGFGLPYVDLGGDAPLLRNASGTLTASSGTTPDGRAYTAVAVTDHGHTVYFDGRGQALLDQGPEGGALRLYYTGAASLPPGSTASLLTLIVLPSGRPITVSNDGSRIDLVDTVERELVASLSPDSHTGTGMIWSDQAGFVSQVFLEWQPIDGRTQIGALTCQRHDRSTVKTTFAYAPADRGRIVDDVTVTER